MAALPQLLRNTEGADVEMAPPGNFIAGPAETKIGEIIDDVFIVRG